MPNKITVVIEALDYTITKHDVEKALKNHFPNTLTRVHEIFINPCRICGRSEYAHSPKGHDYQPLDK